MAKLVVLIHGLIDSKISLWMGKGEIIHLGVICMHVLATLTWLTSPGASSSSGLALAHCPSWHLWLSSTCSCLHTHTKKPHSSLPTPISCAASPFAGRWLWAGHPTLLAHHGMLLYALATHLHAAASSGNLSKTSSRTKTPKYKR